MGDGLDGIFGLNQDETMRIDANTAKTPENLVPLILHPKKYIFSQIFTPICKSNPHGETLPNDLRNTKMNVET